MCVDDGSKDETLTRLIERRAQDPRLEILSLSRNLGKEVALSAGIERSCGAAVIPNKYWTFEAPRSRGVQREFGAFLLVNLVGVGLNVAAAHVIVNVVGAPPGISTKLWANIGAVFGAGFTLFTNFFGYKFFVFRKPLVGR